MLAMLACSFPGRLSVGTAMSFDLKPESGDREIGLQRRVGRRASRGIKVGITPQKHIGWHSARALRGRLFERRTRRSHQCGPECRYGEHECGDTATVASAEASSLNGRLTPSRQVARSVAIKVIFWIEHSSTFASARPLTRPRAANGRNGSKAVAASLGGSRH